MDMMETTPQVSNDEIINQMEYSENDIKTTSEIQDYNGMSHNSNYEHADVYAIPLPPTTEYNNQHVTNEADMLDIGKSNTTTECVVGIQNMEVSEVVSGEKHNTLDSVEEIPHKHDDSTEDYCTISLQEKEEEPAVITEGIDIINESETVIKTANSSFSSEISQNENDISIPETESGSVITSESEVLQDSVKIERECSNSKAIECNEVEENVKLQTLIGEVDESVSLPPAEPLILEQDVPESIVQKDIEEGVEEVVLESIPDNEIEIADSQPSEILSTGDADFQYTVLPPGENSVYQEDGTLVVEYPLHTDIGDNQGDTLSAQRIVAASSEVTEFTNVLPQGEVMILEIKQEKPPPKQKGRKSTGLIPLHIIGHNMDKPVQDVPNGKPALKPRLGVKIPYRNLASQIVSTTELQQQIVERARQKQEAQAQVDTSKSFAKKLTHRLAQSLSGIGKIGASKKGSGNTPIQPRVSENVGIVETEAKASIPGNSDEGLIEKSSERDEQSKAQSIEINQISNETIINSSSEKPNSTAEIPQSSEHISDSSEKQNEMVSTAINPETTTKGVSDLIELKKKPEVLSPNSEPEKKSETVSTVSEPEKLPENVSPVSETDLAASSIPEPEKNTLNIESNSDLIAILEGDGDEGSPIISVPKPIEDSNFLDNSSEMKEIEKEISLSEQKIVQPTTPQVKEKKFFKSRDSRLSDAVKEKGIKDADVKASPNSALETKAPSESRKAVSGETGSTVSLVGETKASSGLKKVQGVKDAEPKTSSSGETKISDGKNSVSKGEGKLNSYSRGQPTKSSKSPVKSTDEKGTVSSKGSVKTTDMKTTSLRDKGRDTIQEKEKSSGSVVEVEPQLKPAMVLKTYTRKRKSNDVSTPDPPKKPLIVSPLSTAQQEPKIDFVSPVPPNVYVTKSSRIIKKKVIWDPDEAMPSVRNQTKILSRIESTAKVHPSPKAATSTKVTPTKTTEKKPNEKDKQTDTPKSTKPIEKKVIKTANEEKEKNTAAIDKQIMKRPEKNEVPKKIKSPAVVKSPVVLKSPGVSKISPGKSPKKSIKRLSEIDRLLMDEGAVNMLYDINNSEDQKRRASSRTTVVPNDKAQNQKELINRTQEIKNELTQGNMIETVTPKILRKKEGPPSAEATKEKEFKEMTGPAIVRKMSKDSSKSSTHSPPPSPSAADASRIIRRHSSSSFSSNDDLIQETLADLEEKDREKFIRKKTTPVSGSSQSTTVQTAASPEKSSKERITKKKANDTQDGSPRKRMKRQQNEDEGVPQKPVEIAIKSEPGNVTGEVKTDPTRAFTVIKMNKHYMINLTYSGSENYLTVQLLKDLTITLRELGRNKNCFVVSLHSQGPAFCLGLDYKGLVESSEDLRKKRATELSNCIREFLKCLLNFPKVIVAGIKGDCVGFGVTMLPLFDMIVASDSANFCTPYGKLGSAPEAGFLLSIPFQSNHGLASELLYTTQRMNADEAQRRGLITKLFWPEKFDTEFRALLSHISNLSKKGLMSTKKQLRLLHWQSTETAIVNNCKTLIELWVSEECQKNFTNYNALTFDIDQ